MPSYEHANGVVLEADPARARAMCPYLGKLSTQEADLLLELAEIGQKILENPVETIRDDLLESTHDLDNKHPESFKENDTNKKTNTDALYPRSTTDEVMRNENDVAERTIVQPLSPTLIESTRTMNLPLPFENNLARQNYTAQQLEIAVATAPAEQDTKKITNDTVLSHKEVAIIENFIETFVQDTPPHPTELPVITINDDLSSKEISVLYEAEYALPEVPLAEESEPSIISNMTTSPEQNDADTEIKNDEPSEQFHHIIKFNTLIETPHEHQVISPQQLEKNSDPIVLPPICLKIMDAFETLNPDSANNAKQLLVKITEIITSDTAVHDKDSLQTHEIPEELQNLCEELFDLLGIEYSDVAVAEFISGIVTTREAMQQENFINSEYIDKGTHEFKLFKTQNVHQLTYLLKQPLVRTIGTLTLHLSRSLAI